MRGEVAVFAGRFASQPLVFAHLLDACDRAGLALDLDHVEVIQGPPDKRLAHVLSAGDAEAVKAARAAEETLVLIFAEALVPGARHFAGTAMLRLIGTYSPIRSRTL